MEDETYEAVSDGSEDLYIRCNALDKSLELAKISGNANAAELVERAKIVYAYLKDG